VDVRSSVLSRAARHAALGDVFRLAIVDELGISDRASIELQARLGIGSNLLAHHLDVLEAAGLVSRSRSSGDGRRRYLRLRRDALTDLVPGRRLVAQPALFVCTANSARSQLAAALWQQRLDAPAESAGTHPVDAVHPGAIAAARRAGLDLSDARPRRLTNVRAGRMVVTVCDRAHEELGPRRDWLHWSIPDPVPAATRHAFDATVAELRDRIDAYVEPQPAEL
jgi:ArsR family transcriptional regulator, arsenate/arsenite/antimonite-responsive transcriptional repressor / arsenate reductase (thioredoxin)